LSQPENWSSILEEHNMLRFTWSILTALLLPVGVAMAQSHGHPSGHGPPAHMSGHAGTAHWSGRPGGSFGAPHSNNAFHGVPAASSLHSNFNRQGNFNRGNFDSRNFARRDFDRRDFDRRGFDFDRGRFDFDRRGFGFRNPWWWFGRGYYPYWGYGYAGYPYGYYNSWYPYDLGYAYSYPDYTYPDYGVAPDDYGAYPPADNGYGAAPSYSDTATSRITITAPAGADIWVEGVKIASGTGAVHTFQTPPLNPDRQYRYRVRAVWTGSDGRTVDQSQEVVFSAGAGVAVRFPTAQASLVPQA
jgi:uncharacterized protein (TIGR03000 family)